MAFAYPALAQNTKKEKKPDRPTPPTRPFDAPSAPKFTRLDGKPGVNPPVDVNGDFVVGPDYAPAPETKVVEGVPQGVVTQFVMESKDCKLFNPGIARDEFGTVDPKNPKTLIVETHPIDYQRFITVYVPAQYAAGTEAPFIVIHDGPRGKPDMTVPHILDNLIAQKRVPAIVSRVVFADGVDDFLQRLQRATAAIPFRRAQLRPLWSVAAEPSGARQPAAGCQKSEGPMGRGMREPIHWQVPGAAVVVVVKAATLGAMDEAVSGVEIRRDDTAVARDGPHPRG